jgi:hypothetical protein
MSLRRGLLLAALFKNGHHWQGEALSEVPYDLMSGNDCAHITLKEKESCAWARGFRRLTVVVFPEGAFRSALKPGSVLETVTKKMKDDCASNVFRTHQ